MYFVAIGTSPINPPKSCKGHGYSCYNQTNWGNVYCFMCIALYKW